MAFLRKFSALVLIILLLVVAAGAVFRYVDSFRDAVLAWLLQPYGIHSIKTDLTGVSVQEIRFNQLDIALNRDGLNTEFHMDQVRLERFHNKTSWHDLRSWSLQALSAQLMLQNLSAASQKTASTIDPFAFLPTALLQKVPVGKIKVDTVKAHYQPFEGPVWRLLGKVETDSARISAKFDLIHGEQAYKGSLALTEKRVVFSVGQGEQPWISVDSSLEYVDQRFVAGGVFALADLADAEDWIALLPVNVPETNAWQGHIKGAFSHSMSRGTLDRWLGGDTGNFDDVVFHAQLSGQVAAQVKTPHIDQFNIQGSARVQFQNDSVRITTINETEWGAIVNAQSPAFSQLAKPLVADGNALALKGAANGSVELNIKDHLMEINLSDSQVSAGPALDNTPNKVDVKALRLKTVNNEAKELSTTAGFDLLLPDKPPLKGRAQLNMNHALNQQNIASYNGQLRVVLQDITTAVVDFNYFPKSQIVDFIIASERANLATETFNNWAEKLHLPVALELGDLEMTMQGSLDLNKLNAKKPAALQAKGSVKVMDWHGAFEKNHFRDLNSPFVFSGDLSDFEIRATVTNGLFDIGIPVTDIRYQLVVKGNFEKDHYQIDITNLESKLVGGLIRIPSLSWDNQVKQTQFNVVIFDWQFAEIIALLKRDDLQVTGKLDGMLPVYVKEDGVEIKQGLLTARSPGGVIKYRPDSNVKAYLSEQQQLKMAIDILEDFHYSQLDVELNQDMQGNQELALKLKGKNPKAYGGTPVNLNLNVEHNIMPLIQSLTLPTKIQDNW